MEHIGKPRRGKKRDRDREYASWKNYMALKVAKLQSQSDVDVKSAKSEIFKGISIYVNGFTDPTAEELKKIILSNGGAYHHYYSRTQTTHIIATHLPNSKVTNRNTDTVVSPKWITESINAGSLLDYKKFLLYSNYSPAQPKLNFMEIHHKFKTEKNGNLIDHDNKLEDSYNDSIESQIISIEKPAASSIDYFSTSEDLLFKETQVVDRPISKQTSTNINAAPHCDPSTTLSTSNPNFIAEYYNNSRLHYLSTAGSMFKRYVKDLQSQEDNFKGREDLKAWIKSNNLKEKKHFEKVIMHIDMDCFFVSVGLVKYPELKGLPVAVTHAKNNKTVTRNKDDFNYEINCIKERHKGNDSKVINSNLRPKGFNIDGNVSFPENKEISTFDLLDDKGSMAEIASCSYEARQKGIKNGMLLGAALKLCSELKTIPYDFEGYEKVSKKLYDEVASFSKEIEAVSCDEMFVDLTQVLNECSVSPLNFATFLRKQIKLQTKCSCSIGLGPNMLIARLATHLAKPNGQHYVDSVDVGGFMKKQEVSNLPGVGGSLCQRLKLIGVSTCGDLQSFSLEYLQKNFGFQTGKSLHDFSKGRDERKINNEHIRKSVSSEINYGIRFQNFSDADRFVDDLCKEVSRRLTDLSLQGKTITLKLKVRAKNAPVETAKFMGHGICDNLSKSFTFHSFTSDSAVIYKVALNLLKQMSLKYEDLRGVGIQVSKLTEKKTCVSNSISGIKTFLKQQKPVLDIRNCENYGPLQIQNTVITKELEKVDDSNKNEKPSNVPDVVHNNVIKDVEEKSTVNILDLEVLSALPAELRQQVIDEYKSHGYQIPSAVESKPELKLQSQVNITDNNDQNTSPQLSHSCLNDSPQPGPSNLPGISVKKENDTMFLNSSLNTSKKIEKHNLEYKNSIKNELECSITSFSQIDDSFIDALPDDIKEDLKNDFEIKKNSKRTLGSVGESVMKPQELNDNKQIKGYHSADSPNKKKILAEEEKSYVHNHEIVLIREKTNNTKLNTPETCNAPNLCGEIDVKSVKNLIKNWILSCENPDSFDTEMLSAYCNELVMDKDLEKLNLILKFIKRKTKLSTTSWQACYKNILNEVQKKMIEIYNAKLFIELS